MEYIRECLYLVGEENSIYWHTRPLHHFGSLRACNRFNTIYANTSAGYKRKVSNIDYIKVKLNNIGLSGHVVVWTLLYGVMPEFPIDHIDGDGANNRSSNLRLCTTPYINARNRKLSSNSASGVNGVYWDRGRKKWRAVGYRTVEGKDTIKFIGRYTTLEAAAAARDVWDRKNGFSDRHGKKQITDE